MRPVYDPSRPGSLALTCLNKFTRTSKTGEEIADLPEHLQKQWLKLVMSQRDEADRLLLDFAKTSWKVDHRMHMKLAQRARSGDTTTVPDDRHRKPVAIQHILEEWPHLCACNELTRMFSRAPALTKDIFRNPVVDDDGKQMHKLEWRRPKLSVIWGRDRMLAAVVVAIDAIFFCIMGQLSWWTWRLFAASMNCAIPFVDFLGVALSIVLAFFVASYLLWRYNLAAFEGNRIPLPPRAVGRVMVTSAPWKSMFCVAPDGKVTTCFVPPYDPNSFSIDAIRDGSGRALVTHHDTHEGYSHWGSEISPAETLRRLRIVLGDFGRVELDKWTVVLTHREGSALAFKASIPRPELRMCRPEGNRLDLMISFCGSREGLQEACKLLTYFLSEDLD